MSPWVRRLALLSLAIAALTTVACQSRIKGETNSGPPEGGPPANSRKPPGETLSGPGAR